MTQPLTDEFPRTETLHQREPLLRSQPRFRMTVPFLTRPTMSDPVDGRVLTFSRSFLDTPETTQKSGPPGIAIGEVIGGSASIPGRNGD